MSFIARVGFALAAAAVAVAIAPGLARADDGAKSDPRDVGGALDIVSVSQAHVGSSLIHTLRVRRPFRSKLLTGSNTIAFTFDGNRDGQIDRLVLVIWYQKALRGVLADGKGHLIGQFRARRPDSRTVRVTLREATVGDVESYGWLGVTTFKDKRACRKLCSDIAPNAGPMVQRIPHESLEVSATGSGRVTSEPKGIDCPRTCSARLRTGTPVTLRATPAAGWVFTGWSGACTGTDACTLRIDAATSVEATFVQTHVLTVSVSGPGAVGVDPPDHPCPGGSSCSFTYKAGTKVTLTAMTGPSYAFDGWTGACAGSGPTCTLTIGGDTAVGAAFSIRSFTLSVSVEAAAGAGGRVTSSPAGIDCPGDCSESYQAETWVTLTATPAEGSAFDGWNDNWCRGLNPTCMVVMGAVAPGDKSLVATFRAGS
jgi:hypothetical protein